MSGNFARSHGFEPRSHQTDRQHKPQTTMRPERPTTLDLPTDERFHPTHENTRPIKVRGHRAPK